MGIPRTHYMPVINHKPTSLIACQGQTTDVKVTHNFSDHCFLPIKSSDGVAVNAWALFIHIIRV